MVENTQPLDINKPKSIKSKMLRWLSFLAIVYVVVVLIFYFFQSYMLFPGLLRQRIAIDGLPAGLEVVRIPTADDENLDGVLFKPEDPRGLVILCHGNGDLICYMLNEVTQLGKRFNVAVLAFDYRGYGNSEGFPTDQRLYADGQAVYDFAIAQGYTGDNIVLSLDSRWEERLPFRSQKITRSRH